MKAFLKNLVEGNGISPSEICLQSFRDNFNDAVSVEWYRKEGYYEAIFYRYNLEHIALFSFNGMLLEYKRNLPVDYLPEPIKELLHAKGEIMNSVLINKGNVLEYEIVLRDKLLKRHLIKLSDTGELKEEIIL